MFGDLQNQMNAMANSLFEAIPEDDEGAEDVSPEDPSYNLMNDNPLDPNNVIMDDGNNIPLSLAAPRSHNDGFSSLQLTDLISSNANALMNNTNNINQNNDVNENNTNKLNENLILNSLKQNSATNLNSTSNSANNSLNANSLDRTGDSDIISASPSVISQKFSEHISENGDIIQENDEYEDKKNNEGLLVPQIQQIATNLINGNHENSEYNGSARSNQSNRSSRSNQSNNNNTNKSSSRSSKSIKSKVSASNSRQNSSALQSPRQTSARSTSNKKVSANSSTSSLTKRQQQKIEDSERSSHPSSRSTKSNNSNLNANDDIHANSSQQSSARSNKSSVKSKTNSPLSSARSSKEKDIDQNNANNTDLSEIIKRPFSVLAGNLEQAQPEEIDDNNTILTDKQASQDEIKPDEDQQQVGDETQDEDHKSETEKNNENDENKTETPNDTENVENKLKQETNNEDNENKLVDNEGNDSQNENKNLEKQEEDEKVENNAEDNKEEIQPNEDNENKGETENNENQSNQNPIEEGLNVEDENPAVEVPPISHFPKRTIYEEEELDSKLQEFIKTNGKSFPRIPVDMRNQLFQHISRRRVQAIENQDYDNGEKLMVAQENLRKAMNKDLLSNEETNEESMNATRLSDAKYELKVATEKWEQNMKDLNYKLKEQEEQIIAAQQAELQKLADFWSDPSKFHEFNKASSHLLSMREIERNMALTGDFQGAKAMKKRALALEKKETQEAQKRAQEAMVQNFEQMKAKHQMQLDGHRRLAHKLMVQEEVKRDYELQPLKMAVRKYETYQKNKIDSLRETKPPPKRNPPVSKSMLVKKTKKDSIILTDDRPPITTPRTMEKLARLRETKRAEQLALTKVETKGVLKRQMKAMRPLREEKEPLSGRPGNGTF